MIIKGRNCNNNICKINAVPAFWDFHSPGTRNTNISCMHCIYKQLYKFTKTSDYGIHKGCSHKFLIDLCTWHYMLNLLHSSMPRVGKSAM